MCGIAGLVRHGGAIERDPSASLSLALAHRGPDGEGVWRSVDGRVVLVHRRLAIEKVRRNVRLKRHLSG